MSQWSSLSQASRFRIALEVARRRGDQFRRAYPNVINVGAGFRSRRDSGRPIEEVCLRFLVPRKWKSARSRGKSIPASIRARVRVGRKTLSVAIPTDVSEFRGGAPHGVLDLTGGITSRNDGANLDYGTACCMVRNAASPGERYLLTCYHVLSPSMNDLPGAIDCVLSAGGRAIGPMLEVADSDGPEVALDAALVLLEDKTIDRTRIWDRYPVARATDYDLTNLVRQSVLYVHARRATPGQAGGARNGPLPAYFQSLFPNPLPFDYRSTAERVFRFSGTLQYVADVRSGDSGAAVMNAQNKLFGMHFYGQGNVGYALAAPRLFDPEVFPFDIVLV